MSLKIVDIISLSKEKPGNWDYTEDSSTTKSKNLIDLNKTQLKFNPDGLDLLKWLEPGAEYSVTSFSTYIQSELVKRGINVKEVKSILNEKGVAEVEVILYNVTDKVISTVGKSKGLING